MKKTKLIQLLQTFETRDFRRFRDYLASPFFNKREDLCAFFEVLAAAAPAFSSVKTEKEAVWKAYAPERPIDEKELGYLLNFLLQHAENYLAISAFESDDSSKAHPVLAHYLNHGLHKHFRSTLQRAQKKMAKEPYRDAEWHLKAWRLTDVEMQFFYSSKSRKTDSSLDRAAAHLDAFYLDKKLEMTSEALNLNHILQAGSDTSSSAALRTYSEQLGTPEATVRLRKLVLNIQQDPEDRASFHALRQLMPEMHSLFPPERVKGIYAYAQNFCIRRIKAGDMAFKDELFQIFKESLAAGAMYENDQLNPWSFKNVCSIALQLGQFEWVERFIQSHEDRISASFRDSAVAYNKAHLHFFQGAYNRSLRLLAQVELSDIYYALDTRRLMLKIYYERGDFESLASLIASFRIFLRRNKLVSDGNRQAYKHFVDWLRRIYEAPPKPDEDLYAKFAVEIERANPIVEREWLLAKLGEKWGRGK